jgi:hypothetical protein
MRSSAISTLGVVTTRLVNPAPGALVNVATMLAAKSRSLALAVATAACCSVALEPVPAAVTSTGLPYQCRCTRRMRTSAYWAGMLNEHRHDVRVGRRGHDVPGVVDRLAQRSGYRRWPDRARVDVAARVGDRVDDAVLSFQPTAMTFRFPAVCAAVYVTATDTAETAATAELLLNERDGPCGRCRRCLPCWRYAASNWPRRRLCCARGSCSWYLASKPLSAKWSARGPDLGKLLHPAPWQTLTR